MRLLGIKAAYLKTQILQDCKHPALKACKVTDFVT